MLGDWLRPGKNQPMVGEIIFYAISFLLHFILLLTGLWVMIKFQKFDYNWLGLLGTALLGSALDMVPYVGHYFAVPALYLCIWKMTRASIFPDASFTVLFAYLFMFVVNMFALTFLTPDLRPDLHPSADEAVTNIVVAAAPTNTPAPRAPVESQAVKAAKAAAQYLSVKGFMRNGAKSMVMLADGTRVYTLYLGDRTAVQTPEGTSRVRFDSVNSNSVTLLVDGIPVDLPIP